MSTTRRQVSLYLPLPEARVINALRRQFNPVQAALIPAHVTLCREDEVDDWDQLQQRLHEWSTRDPATIELEFGAPLRRGHFVFLPVTDTQGHFAALRERLLRDGVRVPRDYEPHVTLIHPRNGQCTLAIFDQIVRACPPFMRTLTEVALIEQTDGGPWEIWDVVPAP